MKVRLGILGAIAAIALGGTLAHACGDKFLVQGSCCVGGKSWARMHAARKPGTILILQDDSSPAMAAVSKSKYEDRLRDVGHTVTTCNRPDLCKLAAENGKVDVLLADAKDADQLREDLRAHSSRTVVVPVVYMAAKAQLNELKEHFDHVFNAPDPPTRLVDLINQVTSRR
jgi:hypothetical protein